MMSKKSDSTTMASKSSRKKYIIIGTIAIAVAGFFAYKRYTQSNKNNDDNKPNDKKQSTLKDDPDQTTNNVQYIPLQDDKHTTKQLETDHSSFKMDKFNQNIIEHDKNDKNDKNPKISNNNTDNDDNKDDNTSQSISSGIPISVTNLIVSSAGYNGINGDYRWFIHNSKWCMFTQDSKHFSIENDIPTATVYQQLNKVKSNFKWDPSVKKCWIISDIDGNVIYYAAPQINKEYIPNDSNKWISVNGSGPMPAIYPNLIHHTDQPDESEHFGNVSVSSAQKINVQFLPQINENINKNVQQNGNAHGNDVEEDDDDDDESISDID